MRSVHEFVWRRYVEAMRDLASSDSSYGRNGAFRILLGSVTLRVICSDGAEWDHVSVSLAERCPILLRRRDGDAASSSWPGYQGTRDFSMVWPKFAYWMLTEEVAPVAAACRFPLRAVDGVAGLYGLWIDGKKPEYSEWDAARERADTAVSAVGGRYAQSAVWAAIAATAWWACAESARWAARSVGAGFWDRAAKKILRLLNDAK